MRIRTPVLVLGFVSLLVVCATQASFAASPRTAELARSTAHPFLVRASSVGRIRLGETGAAVRRSYPKAQVDRYGARGCKLYSPSDRVSALVTPQSHSRIVAIDVYGVFTTQTGLHNGSTQKQVLAVYSHRKHKRFTDGFGEVHIVAKLKSNWIGFWFSETGSHTAERVGIGPLAFFQDAGPPSISPCGQ